jgi:MarR family 2-MHQ and catechol resistance regulon transcriptional repressor
MMSTADLDLQLFRVLARAYQAVADRDRRNIRGYGFNPTEFAVLELLYHKGPHPLQEIGGKILITSGSITYVINKLETKGLVTRQPATHDRRIAYATLTPEGRQLIAGLFPAHAANIGRILAGLDAAEKRTAVDLLKKLGFHAQHSSPG